VVPRPGGAHWPALNPVQALVWSWMPGIGIAP
jgi:hypothetical protein